jgi:hypothetical protein
MADMANVASVIDTSAMVRMNASWQSNAALFNCNSSFRFSYHIVELHLPCIRPA